MKTKHNNKTNTIRNFHRAVKEEKEKKMYICQVVAIDSIYFVNVYKKGTIDSA